VFKPSARVKIIRPVYKKGHTIFRPFPALTPDRKKYEPYRNSADDSDFGFWLVSVPAVKFAGISDTFTMLLFNPMDKKTGTLASNPYVVFQTNLTQAMKTGDYPDPKWSKFIPKPTESDFKMAVKKPQHLVFMQGLVYAHEGQCVCVKGSKPLGANDGDMPTLIEMSDSTRKSFETKFNLREQQWTGADEDYENAFKYGDITHPKKGRFLVIYNPQVEEYGPEDQRRLDEARKNKEGYSTCILRRYKDRQKVYTPNLIGNEEFDDDIVKKNWVEWFDVFNFLPVEEQCAAIARGFKEMPKMLQFAWQGHPEFLTAEVRGILSAKKSVDMGVPDASDDDDDEEEDRKVTKKGRKDADDEFEDDDEVDHRQVDDDDDDADDDDDSDDDDFDDEDDDDDDDLDDDDDDLDDEDDTDADDEDSDDEDDDEKEAEDASTDDLDDDEEEDDVRTKMAAAKKAASNSSARDAIANKGKKAAPPSKKASKPAVTPPAKKPTTKRKPSR
jgi:hypothetical protein